MTAQLLAVGAAMGGFGAFAFVLAFSASGVWLKRFAAWLRSNGR